MTDTDRKAYIITGPTSGIGRATALELARHGTIVLVGRDATKLDAMQKAFARNGQHAVSVVCDLSDPASVTRAAKEIIALHHPIAGLLNNAGVMQMRATTNALGWDTTFATNHLGPFALTEALMPHLPDGANVVFVGSATENPEHKPATTFGFRGGRYISAEASARGEWQQPGGSKMPGADAYATSKQAILAAALALARETPRLHVNVVEPGFNPGTALGRRDATALVRLLSIVLVPVLVPLLRPFIKVLSTPKRAARVITTVLRDRSGATGMYYDHSGRPMQGSARTRDPQFQDRVVAETRALLASVAM
ncbi:putative Short-chain dehydrogenase/reductase SDR [Bradyrhizobium sp. STM 3843]|uniref:SDR family NAD(P)-dependent oxidoreductase n=1 Tax=Bradyrhizobium sp. STM 3843 TaxID=551947 RepID=UPI0002406BFC|nr:SDR family NAD(P)-dependent oxidoreductase [Bradyrhizobium sp. STM 3843]CCE06158.1 putative Short-chain dehydrogenase/reductase SDR [Bradyrhizobium sp. STM 3843]